MTGGFNGASLNVKTNVINQNVYSFMTYEWFCLPLSSLDVCPSCPNGDGKKTKEKRRNEKIISF